MEKIFLCILDTNKGFVLLIYAHICLHTGGAAGGDGSATGGTGGGEPQDGQKQDGAKKDNNFFKNLFAKGDNL